MYTKTVYAGWGDMDLNGHMRNTAYLDKCNDVRQMFLLEHGFSGKEFLRLSIGAVLMNDQIQYFKEVSLLQELTVTYALAGHAPDGSRFLLRNEIFLADGRLGARLVSTGGWLHLVERRIIAPPPRLQAVMDMLERTSDFTVLPSSIKEPA